MFRTGIVLCAGLYLCVCSPLASAPVCVTGSLESYIALGGEGCDLGSGNYSGFRVLPPITGATAIAPADITINPLFTATEVALQYVLNQTARNGELLQALFGYLLTAPAITEGTLTVSGTSSGGGGIVTTIRSVCAGGEFAPGSVTGCSGTASDAIVLGNGTDMQSFTAVALADAVVDITLDAAAGGSASAGVVEDAFVIVPEPGTSGLFLSALAGVAILARRNSGRTR